MADIFTLKDFTVEIPSQKEEQQKKEEEENNAKAK